MIPIRLEFEAFGPFVARQVIDFTAFDNDRLFLISGNTGSGKTTIFDAITFSLYGQASGSIRQSDSFKSDFADSSTVCFAAFTFLVKGKYYVVRREPIQFRLKRGGNIVKESSTATVTLEDGSIISGASNVDNYIEALLGLNAEQFKKIVMLPQGEFRRFLSDDSNEKQKILRKIFSTQLLDDFTERLRLNAAQIKSEIDMLFTECNVITDTICSLDNVDIQKQKQAEQTDFPYLLKLLKGHNDSVSDAALKKKELLSELNNQKESLNLPYYKEINSSFALLERLTSELAQLNACNEQYTVMQNQITKLKSAREIILPYNTKCRLISEINAVKAKLVQYKEKICEYKTTAANYGKLITLFDKQTETSEQIKSDLSLIDSIKRYQKISKTYLSHKNVYQHTFHSFINGQAFLLSITLKDNVPCPVCGSVEHPQPAFDNGETVSKEQLDLAKKNYESSTQQVESIVAQCKQQIQQKGLSTTLDSIIDYLPLVEQSHSTLVSAQKQLLDEISLLPISKELLKSPSQQQLDKLNAQLERGNEALSQNNSLLEELDCKLQDAQAQFEDELSAHSLSEKAFMQLAPSVKTIDALEQKVNAHNNAITVKEEQIATLTTQLQDKSPVNLAVLQAESERLTVQIKVADAEYIALNSALTTNKNCLLKLLKSHTLLQNKTAVHADVNKLFDVANGKYSDKLNFERYVLAAYFDSVINNANLRLEQMTNSRYTLIRREQKEKGNKSSGLAMDVLDAHNGKERHVNTLSGGESFTVALALALGFADIISQNSGGIELNTMFIDEGFGSLDSDMLDSAIDCLHRIRLHGRYIGIISHVSELKEKIPAKISVKQYPTGSMISTI